MSQLHEEPPVTTELQKESPVQIDPEPSCCPVRQVPPEVWQALADRLARKPFRRRHPLLFWGMCIVAVILFLVRVLPLAGDEEESLAGSGDRLALVALKGGIFETEETLKWISTVEQNDEIRGVLLRVDSPGGGASASQELYSALKRLAEKKPLVVSMGSVAASGGLMVSMAGERIFANASTITGSIGVRMDIPQLRGLFDKIGIDQETLVTGPYKDAGSYLRPLSQEERDYLEGILKDMHGQFVEIVAEGRHMTPEQAGKLATGRIFTGREALSLGLIDEIGGQEEARSWLCRRTGVAQNKKLVKKPKKSRWYEDALTTLLDLDVLLDRVQKRSQTRSPLFSYSM